MVSRKPSVVEFAEEYINFVAQIDMQIEPSVVESAEEFTIFVAMISTSRSRLGLYFHPNKTQRMIGSRSKIPVTSISINITSMIYV